MPCADPVTVKIFFNRLKEAPFVPPWLALEEGEKIAARLAGIRREMELDFKRQIIEAARIEAPEARLLEFDRAVPVPVLTGKAFDAH